MKLFKNKEMIKNILFAFTLSTTVLFIFWNIKYGAGYLYASNRSYLFAYLSLIIVNTILSVIFSLIFIFLSTSKNVVLNIIGNLILSGLLFLFFCGILQVLNYNNHFNISLKYFWRFISVIFFFLIIMYIINRKKTFIVVRGILIMLFPLVIYFHYVFVRDYIRYSSENKKIVLHKPTEDVPRVVILIFDELDYYLTFSNRPEKLMLSELDEFRKLSFFSERAKSPNIWTMPSMISYISGKPLINAYVFANHSLLLHLKNNQKEIFSKKSNTIFSDISKMNLNSALIGWYHPYSRIVKDVTRCFTFTSEATFFTHFKSIFQKTINYYIEVLNQSIPRLEIKPLNIFNKYSLTNYIYSYESILAKTQHFASNKAFNFVFTHFSIPHSPGVYNLEKNEIAKTTSYLGNLKLVDITLKKIKEDMLANNTWDKTTIIITGDHALRTFHKDNHKAFTDIDFDKLSKIKPDDHIPFMVKFPNQQNSYNYAKEFNTLLVYDIILSILKKEICNSDELASYIDINSKKYQ